MVLLLSDADVMEAIGGADAMRRAIDLMEQGYADQAEGRALFAPRIELNAPAGAARPDADFWFGSALGVHPSADAIGGRIFARRPGEARPGDGGHGQWKLLWDMDTLELLCLMEDVSLHPYMVGAHVGVGIKWLAGPDAQSVAILGSGDVSLGCLRASLAVRDVRHVHVFSPNPAHREAFAERAAKALSIDVRAVDSAETAVRGADIVLCATNAGQAVYEDAWLDPGAHVTSVGEFEIDAASFLRGKFIPSTTAGLKARRPPLEPYQTLLDRGGIPPENLPGDLTEVITGGCAGRTSPSDITISHSSAPGYQHAAIGRWVYEEARARGLGHEWTLER